MNTPIPQLRSLALPIAAVALTIVAGAASLRLLDAGLPAPLGADAPAQSFSAARAMAHLRVFAARPRPVGSADHARTRDYLLERLSVLGVEVTRERGLSTATWFTNFHLAGTVENIVARIPGTEPGNAMLFVGHYDSVEIGPGAADDASAVAAFLEVIANLRTGAPPRNDLLFLFSDAEEMGLLGARMFLARDRRMTQVRAVFNFDARGTAGPHLLFETGPRSAALVRHYRDAVAAPRGNSLANAVYPLLVNDTDFSPFRAAGLPGLNFALIDGLPRYHTATDSLAHLDQRSLQHLGEQTLSLARHFGELRPDALRDNDEVVFCNLAGNCMIAYSASLARVMALASLAALILLSARGLRRRRLTARGMAAGAGIALVWLTAAALASWCIHTAVLALHPGLRFMTLGEPYNAGWYRAALSGLAILIVSGTLAHRRFRDSAPSLFAGILTLWSAVCLATTFFLPGASYLFQLPLAAGLVMAPALLLDASPSRRAVIMVLSLLVIFFAVPIVSWLHDAVGFQGAPVSGLATALFLTLLAPLIMDLAESRRFLVPCLAALALAAGLAGGFATDHADAGHPRQDTVAYGLDADRAKALWFSCDPAVDHWTAQFFTNPARRAVPELIPIAPNCLVTADLPMVNDAPILPGLAGPELRLIADGGNGADRRITLTVRSVRGAPTAMLFIRDNGTLREIAVNGQPIPNVDESALKPGQRFLMSRLDYRGWRLLRLSPLDPAGIAVTITRWGPGPIECRITDSSPGIPAIAGITVRPAGLVASPHYFLHDATMASRLFRFPDRRNTAPVTAP